MCVGNFTHINMVKRLIQKTSVTPEQIKNDLLNYTNKVNDCMEWRGSRATDGYPVLFGNKKVHREIYKLHTGRCIDNLVVRHKCDNILCINPDHLIEGSPLQNVQDRVLRGRCYRVLTPDKIVRTMSLLETNLLSQKEIANIVGIDPRRVSDIHRKLYSPEGEFLGRKKVG